MAELVGVRNAVVEHVIRPWGSFDVYASNEACTVKILTVHPGERLSRQYHEHRDELWIVLDPGLVLEVGDEQVHASVGQEVVVPRGVVHRIGSEGPGPGRVLEVAFGDFHEDDIIRLSDDYGRTARA